MAMEQKDYGRTINITNPSSTPDVNVDVNISSPTSVTNDSNTQISLNPKTDISLPSGKSGPHFGDVFDFLP